MFGSTVVCEGQSEADEKSNEFGVVGYPWNTVYDLPPYEKSNEGMRERVKSCAF